MSPLDCGPTETLAPAEYCQVGSHVGPSAEIREGRALGGGVHDDGHTVVVRNVDHVFDGEARGLREGDEVDEGCGLLIDGRLEVVALRRSDEADLDELRPGEPDHELVEVLLH